MTFYKACETCERVLCVYPCASRRVAMVTIVGIDSINNIRFRVLVKLPPGQQYFSYIFLHDVVERSVIRRQGSVV